MKQIAPNYTYNKTTGVITLTGVNIDRDQLLLIVNTTRNVTYYNFADSATTLQAFTQGANTSFTLASSVVSASSAHTNADALTIYYDDQASSGAMVIEDLGVKADAVATTDTGTFSVIALVKRGLQNWTSLLAKIPTLVSGRIPVDGSGVTQPVSLASVPTHGVTGTFWQTTQPVSGTVTANVFGKSNGNDDLYPIPVNETGNGDISGRHIPIGFRDSNGESAIISNNSPLPISGTVTANVFGVDTNENTLQIPVEVDTNGISDKFIPIGFNNDGEARQVSISYPLPVTATPLQGSNATNTSFASTTSAPLVGADAGREVLTVFNEGAGTLFINVGSSSCSTTSYQVRLTAGEYWEAPAGQSSLAHTAIFGTAGTARVTQVI